MILEDAINKAYSKLNDNEIMVLNYIKSHKESCVKFSITELAKQCSVSNSFILRFSQKLGYSGFSELKYQLKSELNSLTKIEFNVLEQSKIDIYETFKLMDNQTFKELPEILDKATHIYAYGTGYAQRTILEDFKRGMINSNRFILSLPTSIELKLNASQMNEASVLFVVSMRGEVESIQSTLQELVLLGVKVISITLLQSNPLARITSYNLYVQSTPLTQQLNNEYLSYAPLCILFDNIVKTYLSYKSNQS